MKLDLSRKEWNWSLSVSGRISAILLAGLLALHAQDDPKSRIKAVKELAEHGTTDVPMSAEQCKQAWTIDDVSWVCR